ncbi:MAG: diacylglycerol kinase family protein [Prolixibacteraceae bacterium]|jgi:undecaprenol kinase/diacylglycerol kinase (ATP)
MKQQSFSLSKRLKSFGFAFNGLRIMIKEEHNFRIQLIAAFCVLVAGFVFHLSEFEWIAIIFSIGFVFALEIINTSIENMADFISPEKNEKIKLIKDLASAGVLIGAITAVVVGLIILLPKFIELLYAFQ